MYMDESARMCSVPAHTAAVAGCKGYVLSVGGGVIYMLQHLLPQKKQRDSEPPCMETPFCPPVTVTQFGNLDEVTRTSEGV